MQFWDFPNLSYYVVRQLVDPLVYTMFIANNHASFHLWWKKNLVKHQNTLKMIVVSPWVRYRPQMSYTSCIKKQHFYTRLKLAKNQAKLSNTLGLNFCYLKIIRILYPRCHPKIIGDILKNKQKFSTSVLWGRFYEIQPV